MEFESLDAARAHILEGVMQLEGNRGRIVDIAYSSSSYADAVKRLQESSLGLSESQAMQILNSSISTLVEEARSARAIELARLRQEEE